MTRIASRPVTLRVGSKTPLAATAAATAGNAFRPFSGDGLSNRLPHPASGTLCDVTEDGQSANHTLLDWCGKGVYDPIRKRAQWIGHGTGSYAGQWRFNTLSFYDETTDQWSAIRGFRHSDQQSNDNALAMTHTYDNNCIDVAGRRHYKKQMFNDNDSWTSGKWFVFDLDQWQFTSSIDRPAGDSNGAGFGPADFVPTRGSAGRIWYANGNPVRIWEYDPALGTGLSTDWTVVVPGGSFPALPPNFRPARNGGVMSYNPRAFGGAGGLLLGGGSDTGFTIRADSLRVAPVAPAPVPLGFTIGGRLCRDPAGPGWLLFVGSLGYVYRCDGTTWTQKAALPAQLPGKSFIVIPIDEHGVVWVISSRPARAGEPRAWLYRP